VAWHNDLTIQFALPFAPLGNHVVNFLLRTNAFSPKHSKIASIIHMLASTPSSVVKVFSGIQRSAILILCRLGFPGLGGSNTPA
jgi:hypothetical protein